MKFLWPVNPNAWMTQGYSKNHPAYDWGIVVGTPIKAMAPGTVNRIVTKYKGYGKHIVLDHGNFYQTLYAHLNSFNVKDSQPVFAGQTIGLSDTTGNCTGPHVHIEAKYKGKQFDYWSSLVATPDEQPPVVITPPLELPDFPHLPVFLLNVNGLRLRSQPNTNSRILGYLSAGQSFSIIQVENHDGDLWAQIGHKQYFAIRWHGNIYGKFLEVT